jgi:RNA polymerase sigma-70 factor (ECF subfamily)
LESFQEKFEKLFRKYRTGMLHFAISITGNVEDAEEVVNDIFINIWDKQTELKEELGIKSYLFRSVKNRSLNKIRSSKTPFETMSEELPLAGNFTTGLEQIQFNETRDKVQYFVDQLPTRCRQVFLLSRVHELSHKEIAELMDISVKTVENQIGYALKFLREALKPLD